MTNTTNTTTCPKCLGAKILRPFMHIDNGRCFTCAGAGVIEVREGYAARPIRSRESAEDRAFRVRGEVRAMYRNAKNGACSYEDATSEGYTHEHVVNRLSEVPGALEAFRALGWPV